MNASPGEPGGEGSALLAQIAAAADLTLRPLRHGVRFQGGPTPLDHDCHDCRLLIEARRSDGERLREADLELEIFRSGADLNLVLSRVHDEAAPMLWHGQHPVWMDAASGERRPRPEDGPGLEALARRVRALLVLRDPVDP